MLPHEAFDLAELILGETPVEFQSHRFEPELGLFAFPCDVNVWWLPAIAGIEEETVRTAVEDRRAHQPILAGLESQEKQTNRIRLTIRLQPRRPHHPPSRRRLQAVVSRRVSARGDPRSRYVWPDAMFRSALC